MIYPLHAADILVDLSEQTLYLPKHNKLYVVSTGEKGIGEAENSV